MSRKSKRKTKISKLPKIQFCVKTLKFYKVNDGERDYSIHEMTLQTKVDNDLAIGNERREDPEIRLIKFLVGKSTEKGKVVYKEPKWIQQVLREFPVLVQKIHHIQLSGAEEGNLQQISEKVLKDFFNHTTSFLIETGREDHAKLVVKLTGIFNALRWREVRRTSQATTKTERITNFLARDIQDLL
tara:strand:- start:226 stop:783 length:558 start_codon:yes stop_codon:yes gene_type:complete